MPYHCFTRCRTTCCCADSFPSGLEAESFDRILLDAPCSALGQRPRLHLRVDLPQLQRAASYQRALLRSAAPLLRVGGVLVYSTCTFNHLENEGNVSWFLHQYPQFKLVEQQPRLGGPGIVCAAGVPRENGGEQQETGLSLEEAKLVQRFDGTEGDTIAFFIAKFQKFAPVPDESEPLRSTSTCANRCVWQLRTDLCCRSLHNHAVRAFATRGAREQ